MMYVHSLSTFVNRLDHLTNVTVSYDKVWKSTDCQEATISMSSVKSDKINVSHCFFPWVCGG